MLGAIAERTERVDIVTAVTCPTIRYHPAIIAQAAATVALMSEGRFGLGVGAGELLNEHVVGDAWPGPDIRHDMLSEAIEVMRLLWRGGRQRHHGDYYDVQDAQLFTLPDTPPEVYVAGGGPRALRVAAEQGDGMFATAPERSLVDTYRSHGGEGKRFGQLAVCFDADEEKATRTAHERWRFARLPSRRMTSVACWMWGTNSAIVLIFAAAGCPCLADSWTPLSTSSFGDVAMTAPTK